MLPRRSLPFEARSTGELPAPTRIRGGVLIDGRSSGDATNVIREAIDLQPNDAVQITVSGGSLIITPARVGLGKSAVSSSLKALRPRYQKMLRNLAK